MPPKIGNFACFWPDQTISLKPWKLDVGIFACTENQATFKDCTS